MKNKIFSVPKAFAALLLMFMAMLFAFHGCTAKTGLDVDSLQHSFPSPSRSHAALPSPAASPSKEVASLTGEISASLYFANSDKDPDVLKPEITYPVKVSIRAGKDDEIFRKILEELLKGPPPEYKDKGYYTALPPRAKINSVNYENGTIHVDFNEALNQGGGSCEMDQRRSQIENTLKNVSGREVKKVILSVNGDAQNVLQP
jgi:spore germination protein GerM